MRVLVVLTALSVGCKGAIDPFDPSQTATVPGWIEAELAGQEDACSSSPYWDDPQVTIATGFYAGNYEWRGDDLYGNEFWFLWPDPQLEETGFHACVVVWDILGNRADAVGAGDYSIDISALLDEDQTDCAPNSEGVHVYEGEESFTVTYDVAEAGGNAQVFFTSGDLLGRGRADNSGLSWLSEKNCAAF